MVPILYLTIVQLDGILLGISMLRDSLINVVILLHYDDGTFVIISSLGALPGGIWRGPLPTG